MELTMPRPGRVFLHGEKPVCAMCNRPRFVLLGGLLYCDSKAGSGNDRGWCGTAHYYMSHPAGHSVLIRVTSDEATHIRHSDEPGDELLALGLPQMAQEMLSGVRKAA